MTLLDHEKKDFVYVIKRYYTIGCCIGPVNVLQSVTNKVQYSVLGSRYYIKVGLPIFGLHLKLFTEETCRNRDSYTGRRGLDRMHRNSDCQCSRLTYGSCRDVRSTHTIE